MKKLLALLLVIPFLFACSSDDKDEDDGGIIIDKPLPIVGVWENSNHFVSFNSEGFYSAYIADEFIDSGDYIRVDNTISCNNTYFKRKTTYSIKNISDTKLNVDISYTDLDGKSNTMTIEFVKSKATPASKSETLTGKSYTLPSIYFGQVTRTFNTFNSGVKIATKGNASKYPLTFYYIYIGNKIYFQTLRPTSPQVPSIGGWTTDYDTIHCWELSFSPNGSIDNHEIINL